MLYPLINCPCLRKLRVKPVTLRITPPWRMLNAGPNRINGLTKESCVLCGGESMTSTHNVHRACLRERIAVGHVLR